MSDGVEVSSASMQPGIAHPFGRPDALYPGDGLLAGLSLLVCVERMPHEAHGLRWRGDPSVKHRVACMACMAASARTGGSASYLRKACMWRVNDYSHHPKGDAV